MSDSGSPADAESKSKIFISYSRKDTTFVDQVEEALKVRNFHPLIDRSDIYVFEDWWRRVQSLIVQADTVILVLSPDYVSSDVCRKEVEFAASRNKRFAPLEYRSVDCKLIPDQVERLNFEFCVDMGQFEQNMERLTAALQTDIEWIRKHTEFGTQAHDWVAEGRPRGLLLRSPKLEEAERWSMSRPKTAPMPTTETQAFIAESRRVTAWQRDVVTAVLTAGLLLALGLAGLAYWQRGTAVKATAAAQAEAARSKLALDTTRQIANALVLKFGKDARLLPRDLQQEIFDRAIQGYSQVIKLDPMNAINYNDRGNAFFGKANLDGDAANYNNAVADYSHAITLDPNYAVAYSNRCWVGVVVGKDLQRALSDCDAAQRIDPQNVRALDNRGFAYLKRGRVDDAIESFNAALRIDPKLPTALYGRGLAKMRTEDREGAEADMAAATAIKADVAEDLAHYDIK
jgi:tetratricopeptide (TPR) repeat protein